MVTKEQARASFALEMITECFRDKVDKDTANFIVGAPTMILTNGLGQSMAFLLSKKDKEKHKNLFLIIKKWLSKECAALNADADMDFLKQLAAAEQKTYVNAQNEALAMLQWLKRYARAFQEGGR
ncbi:MAG TPA: type III-B CRISPR module-associated protein Cmr5 [Candidatus Goldiibacteriota bacterium]|nr:type III-B CRISPR module-associated protein Cmr5 [Candidatus Goldiibacteriota bacterium]